MKKKSSYLSMIVTCGVLAFASTSVYATTIDTSLVDSAAKVAAPNFALEHFSSCSDMRTKLADFMELYYAKYPPYSGRGGGGVMYDLAVPTSTVAAPNSGAVMEKSLTSGNPADYSTTNTRTIGVDEPEKVKTDGTYLYTARIEDKAIYINKADDSLELVTKILLPEEYSSAELFVDGNKLVVLAGKYYWSETFRNAWIDRASKSIVIVYDITDRKKPLIERYSQIDGNVSEARMKDGQLTLLTTTSFNFPVERYMPKVQGTSFELDIKKLSADFSTANVLPKKIEFKASKTSGNINETIANARKLKRVNEKNVVNCGNISYVLPDEATLKSHNFSPVFTTITQINVRNAARVSTSTMMFGDVGKAYLAASGKLFVSSTLYTSGTSACPPGAMCIMRWIEPGSQTVIHEFDTNSAKAKYLGTGIIPGTLLTDYAIDENAAGEVRLVTQTTGQTEKKSELYILNSSLVKIASLSDLGKGENFQSARFIGDRLYLVTFKQVDPLFVIDLKDSTNPKILGELKIPGYSTYLHPYDNDRLIGIGYDTKTNEWGGTVNSGVKVDLYNVADVAHPTQEATLTLGGQGSYSDALSNPRLFVWQKSKNTLYLPIQINTSASGSNSYVYSDIFQGMVSLKIDAAAATGSKIRELARVSHLIWDEAALIKARDADCVQYQPKEKVCRKLITGEEVCTTTSSNGNYIPEYCYANSGINAYKASIIWNKYDQFIDRVMYSGDRTFTFSRYEIRAWENNDALTQKGVVILGTSPVIDVPTSIKGVPMVK